MTRDEMTREKIIEKFKENAEKIPNKWGEVCWVFIDENFEEIADELLALFEQERKEVVKEFVAWLADRFESRIDEARDQYLYALKLHNTLDCCLWSREQNVLQRTHDFLDSDLANFFHQLEMGENKNE